MEDIKHHTHFAFRDRSGEEDEYIYGSSSAAQGVYRKLVTIKC